MTQRRLEQCNEPGLVKDLNLDPPVEYCGDDGSPNLNDPDDKQPDLGWLKQATEIQPDGSQANCDPMQTGQIINSTDRPDRNTIYRYSRALRGTDEAMVDLFKNVVVIDVNSKAWPVPIKWATQERAVAYVMQDNVRKDNSLVVDRLKLPLLAIHSTNYEFDSSRYIYHKALNYMRDPATGKPGFTVRERWEKDTIFGVAAGIPVNVSYTLYGWTWFEEDFNHIFEQIILKFSQLAYIRVRGVPWEVGVKLESVANNVDTNPGDQAQRIFKFQFNLLAETYIPQPLVRKKAVLKTKIDIVEGLEEEDIVSVIDKIENAVEELKS
jgi:hypothetical protein